MFTNLVFNVFGDQALVGLDEGISYKVIIAVKVR